MENDKLVEAASALTRWYVQRMRELPSHSCLEKCELLLAASDLKLESWSIKRAVEELLEHEQTPPPGEDSIFYSLARQLVLMRFNVGEEIRRKFLDYWIVGQRYRGETITTVAFFMTLALEQLGLLPDDLRSHVRDWYHRHGEFESDRYAAWSCFCLALAGYEQEARTRAVEVLSRREANGSWAYELRRTIACCYPLVLAKLAGREQLADTLRYIAAKLALGYSGDVATQAQALKMLFLLGVVPDEEYRMILSKVANEGSVFLSHTTPDKPFVRRLAADLEAWGVRVWLDEAELLPGDSLLAKIEGAIEEMQYLAVVLTPRSVASHWVLRELRMAQIQELAAREVRVLPLLVEQCAVPLSLRDIYWADFSKDYSVGLSQALHRILPGSKGSVTAPNTIGGADG